MRHLFSTNQNQAPQQHKNPIANQDGSVILIALMLLVLMTIIAISASSTSTVESYIIRNANIHKQNLSLVESAALDLAEIALNDIIDPANASLSQDSPVKEPWIIRETQWDASAQRTAWYDVTAATSGRVFDTPGASINDPYITGVTGNPITGSTAFPQWIQPDVATDLTTIANVRRETGSPLRAALVGWVSAPGSSLKGTKATRKQAKVMAEYVSPDYGMARIELGIEREF